MKGISRIVSGPFALAASECALPYMNSARHPPIGAGRNFASDPREGTQLGSGGLLTVSFLEREMRDRCALGKSELIWRGGEPIPSSRIVAEERPVALTYNGSTYAVMMASPADLVDFGIGFSR